MAFFSPGLQLFLLLGGFGDGEDPPVIDKSTPTAQLPQRVAWQPSFQPAESFLPPEGVDAAHLNLAATILDQTTSSSTDVLVLDTGGVIRGERAPMAYELGPTLPPPEPAPSPTARTSPSTGTTTSPIYQRGVADVSPESVDDAQAARELSDRFRRNLPENDPRLYEKLEGVSAQPALPRASWTTTPLIHVEGVGDVSPRYFNDAITARDLGVPLAPNWPSRDFSDPLWIPKFEQSLRNALPPSPAERRTVPIMEEVVVNAVVQTLASPLLAVTTLLDLSGPDRPHLTPQLQQALRPFPYTPEMHGSGEAMELGLQALAGLGLAGAQIADAAVLARSTALDAEATALPLSEALDNAPSPARTPLSKALTRFYWTGGDAASGAAELAAIDLNWEGTLGQTIADLPGYQEASALSDAMRADGVPWPRIQAEVWEPFSQMYAEGSVGSPEAFVNSVKPNSVWSGTEFPTLMNNPNVDEIIIRYMSKAPISEEAWFEMGESWSTTGRFFPGPPP